MSGRRHRLTPLVLLHLRLRCAQRALVPPRPSAPCARRASASAARAERNFNSPKGKGYARCAGDEEELDPFYDEQLKSDGWHLDEVEDDDLDFEIPVERTPAPPRRTGLTRYLCCCIPI